MSSSFLQLYNYYKSLIIFNIIIVTAFTMTHFICIIKNTWRCAIILTYIQSQLNKTNSMIFIKGSLI